MYVILVYDVDQKRTAKMLKLCRRYLSWIQNSVFEGEISEVQLKQLTSEARNLMDEKDSLIFFKSRDEKCMGHRTKRILRVGRKRRQTY